MDPGMLVLAERVLSAENDFLANDFLVAESVLSTILELLENRKNQQ